MAAPLLITGMHRSGTTLLVRLLREQGYDFGEHLDPNLEDFFFLRRNEWLLRLAGGSWEQPTAAVEFLRRPDELKRAQELFRRHVSEERETAPAHWGWKDPRAIFTLPVWEGVFPGAKLIYIRRNGVDVAASLRERTQLRKRSEGLADKLSFRARGLVERIKNPWRDIEFHQHFLFASQEFRLDVGFALWRTYVEQAERAFAQFPGPKLALSYEDILRDPQPNLEALANFAALPDPTARAQQWAPSMRSNRAFAFRDDPELRAFYQEHQGAPPMRNLGYGELL